ncbi:hypothetical protein KP509_36G063200 [Ceratopteris richardii]|uniref:RRP15-like protein n=1 Tax=Ceratopteris richardii TaxID=49495 RepID=A0A8T2QDN8_CERRI|nr:hypothetical protein KP509_36G063200 [Ceratopteris richardii]
MLTSCTSTPNATEEQSEKTGKDFGYPTENEFMVDSEEEHAEDGNTMKRDGSTAFGRAFQRIMKRKLASSGIDEATGPILSAHKQLLAKKLEAADEGQKTRKESKKEKQALRERGHVVPAPSCTAKEKELMKLATRGVVKLFNAVNRVQSVQDCVKATKSRETKDVLKWSKSTFLAMLQDGNGSNPSMQKGLYDKKEVAADHQRGWSALQDTFMLGKTKLKDWDKKQDKNDAVEGMGGTTDDSDSE